MQAQWLQANSSRQLPRRRVPEGHCQNMRGRSVFFTTPCGQLRRGHSGISPVRCTLRTSLDSAFKHVCFFSLINAACFWVHATHRCRCDLSHRCTRVHFVMLSFEGRVSDLWLDISPSPVREAASPCSYPDRKLSSVAMLLPH